jgi:hypothetical protein
MPRPKIRREVAIPTDDEIISLANVSPEIAGRYLGKSSQYIRSGLQYRLFPFGTAVKHKQWCYQICGPALVKFKREGIVFAAPPEDEG